MGFNSGNVAKFRQLKPKWSSQADLAKNEAVLMEKVCLLCLMEMTFRREATERQISFAEIAQATSLPVDQVELLVMKALSEELVSLTWVQPRVLDRDQLLAMTRKIESWANSV